MKIPEIITDSPLQIYYKIPNCLNRRYIIPVFTEDTVLPHTAFCDEDIIIRGKYGYEVFNGPDIYDSCVQNLYINFKNTIMVNYGSIYFEYAPSDPPSTYKFLEFFEKLLSVCEHYKIITTIDNTLE
jgi:hypothetical protein